MSSLNVTAAKKR